MKTPTEEQNRQIVILSQYKNVSEHINEEILNLFRETIWTYNSAIDINAEDFALKFEKINKVHSPKNVKTELDADCKHIRIFIKATESDYEVISKIKNLVKPVRQAFLTLSRNPSMVNQLSSLVLEQSVEF